MAKARKNDVTARFVRTAPLVVVVILVLLGLAAWAQPHLGEVLARDWPFAVLPFLVTALTWALPGRFPLVASIVLIIASAVLSHFTGLTAGALVIVAIAGFFFGMVVRSLGYTLRARRQQQLQREG